MHVQHVLHTHKQITWMRVACVSGIRDGLDRKKLLAPPKVGTHDGSHRTRDSGKRLERAWAGGVI